MHTGEIVKTHSAVITNIQGFSIHDGPGIRTVVFQAMPVVMPVGCES